MTTILTDVVMATIGGVHPPGIEEDGTEAADHVAEAEDALEVGSPIITKIAMITTVTSGGSGQDGKDDENISSAVRQAEEDVGAQEDSS